MSTTLEIVFWLSAACVAYTFALYPLLLELLGRLRPRPVGRGGPAPGSVAIILAAHNEAAVIVRRVKELTGLLRTSRVPAELIVVSNDSTDDTAALARAAAGEGVRVVELAGGGGKAAALTAAVALTKAEVVVFADARQTWAPDVLHLLLENFEDPEVGAVSGELILQSAPGVMTGVGYYWRYEKRLRRAESHVHSMVSVTGAICAVRRSLFRPIPPGTVLDDVYWPLQVVLQGYRVVHDARALAFDRLPQRARDEFRRKVRTLSGNYQLLTLLPAALLPWRNPVWLQLVSHKLLRLVVPWALLALLLASAALPGVIYHFAFWAQVYAYGMGVVGLWRHVGRPLRPAGAAASFLVLNSAAWLAFWVWAAGRTGRSWTKVKYEGPPPGETAPEAAACQPGPAAGGG